MQNYGFMTQLSVHEILANIDRANQEVRKWEREYQRAIANCSHSFQRDRESDGHTTQFVYKCLKCYWITNERPLDASQVRH